MLTLFLSFDSQRFEFRSRAIVVVGMSIGDQLLNNLAVAVEPIGLPVGSVRASDVDALVPIQTEPTHTGLDVIFVLLLASLDVGVVNPEYEGSAVVSGKQPVEEGRTDVAHMEEPGWRWSDPNAYSHAFTTGLVRTPIDCTSTSTTSPSTIGPTPAGVPVRMTSPGNSVITLVTYSTSSATPKTRSVVCPV